MSELRIDGKTMGQVAFEAYRAAVQGAAYDDKPIPEWGELHGNRDRVHRGWEAAADAVSTWALLADAADRGLRQIDEDGPRGVDYRPMKSHAQPLDLTGTQIVEDLPPAPVTGLTPVSDERAARAAHRVGVEADDETGDDAA